MQSCRTVAQCYRSLHLGIDLMFEPGLEAHRIIEANAFGTCSRGSRSTAPTSGSGRFARRRASND